MQISKAKINKISNRKSQVDFNIPAQGSEDCEYWRKINSSSEYTLLVHRKGYTQREFLICCYYK